MGVTKEELQRVAAAVKGMSRSEFDALSTEFVGSLARLCLVVNDKLKLSGQYSSLAI